jgi:hypothetical protein
MDRALTEETDKRTSSPCAVFLVFALDRSRRGRVYPTRRPSPFCATTGGSDRQVWWRYSRFDGFQKVTEALAKVAGRQYRCTCGTCRDPGVSVTP